MSKIIQVVDSLTLGGAEKMAVNVSNLLHEKNQHVSLIVSRTSGPLINYLDKEIPVYYLNKSNFLDIKSFVKIIKIIKKEHPDIIHAHSTSVYWISFLKPFYNFSLVFHDHDGMSESLNVFSRPFLRICSLFIDKVIVVNDLLYKWNIKYLFVSKNRILNIKNFSNLNVISNTSIPHSNDKLKIVCVANFRPQKDHFTLIDAVYLLVNKYKFENFKVLLAGSIVDPDYYNHVLDQINEKKLSDYFELLGPQDDVSPVLYSCDIGVLCSISEGLPLTLLEYGYAGLPVVVSDVGECAEVIGNGEFGLLFKPKDSDLFSEHLYSLLTEPEFRLDLANSFNKFVSNNYSEDSFYLKYSSFLNLD